jgi:hypothetical protein
MVSKRKKNRADAVYNAPSKSDAGLLQFSVLTVGAAQDLPPQVFVKQRKHGEVFVV